MINTESDLEVIVEEVPSKQRFIHPEIDASIDDGLALVEHARNVGITRQGVHYYLKRRGMHQRWKQSRQALKLRQIQEADKWEQALSQIVALLEKRAVKLAAEKSWACQKAFEYLQVHKRSNIPLDEITRFLQRYNDAVVSAKTPTVPELGYDMVVSSGTLYNILASSGVRPLNRSNKRKFIPNNRKAIILRGSNLKMSYGDMSYYSKLPEHVLYYFFKTNKIVRPKVRSNLKMIGDKALTYRLASNVYEALDLGFSKGEIAELFDTSEEIVDYASEHRKQLSKFIIKCLRTLYPSTTIEKPYIET